MRRIAFAINQVVADLAQDDEQRLAALYKLVPVKRVYAIPRSRVEDLSEKQER